MILAGLDSVSERRDRARTQQIIRRDRHHFSRLHRNLRFWAHAGNRLGRSNPYHCIDWADVGITGTSAYRVARGSKQPRYLILTSP